MKIRKGEVILFISPNDWLRFRKSGWKRMQEPSVAKIKEYNQRRLMKGLKENAK